MNVIGVIPARYNSSRFQGKPLADILGKPMIWWVYNRVAKVQGLDDIYIATDDERISSVCEKFGFKYIITSINHKTPIDRVWEVSNNVDADLYVCINGDEPLIDPKLIESVIPNQITHTPYVGGAISVITDPAEVVDFTISKVIVNNASELVWTSRSPIPYPKGTMDFKYKKLVGIQCFDKAALDMYVNTKRSVNELAEECDMYRFLENGVKVSVIESDSKSMSVDTPKDLEYVCNLIKEDSI